MHYYPTSYTRIQPLTFKLALTCNIDLDSTLGDSLLNSLNTSWKKKEQTFNNSLALVTNFHLCYRHRKVLTRAVSKM